MKFNVYDYFFGVLSKNVSKFLKFANFDRLLLPKYYKYGNRKINTTQNAIVWLPFFFAN